MVFLMRSKEHFTDANGPYMTLYRGHSEEGRIMKRMVVGVVKDVRVMRVLRIVGRHYIVTLHMHSVRSN